jgi:lipid-A-disaccharide synthase
LPETSKTPGPEFEGQILISAGEASGDYYAAELLKELRTRMPKATFFGCAGPNLRAAGAEAVVQTEDLAVVGLVEVVRHLPRIYSRFRTLVAAAKERRPVVAILTDSPDFHFRVAAKLKKLGIPVVYLVAPQVWAWRKGRVKTMREIIDRLLCIFPFEEAFFNGHGIPTTYIGHPLAGRVQPTLSREDFFRKHNISDDRPLIAVLPGSRPSEALRHVPELRRAANILTADRKLSFIVPASRTCGAELFHVPFADSPVRAIESDVRRENVAWDALAYCDLALAASGTVTVEAALLGAPMVTYYRVSNTSWEIGQWLLDVPFYCMVNLIAERKIVPELMQEQMTGEALAAETRRLLDNAEERAKMKEDLAEVARRLGRTGETVPDVMIKAADEVQAILRRGL